MVGTIVGAAIQGASAIGGAIASSQANKKMMQLIGDEEERNRKWYDLEMSKDWMQRPEAQNALRKVKELLKDQYQRTKATNVVAGGTDEALALQQQGANEVVGETGATIASQAAAHKDEVESQYQAKQSALNQQKMAVLQGKADNIAAAAGQMGQAVSGLMGGGETAPKMPTAPDGAGVTPQVLGGTTTAESYAKADATAGLANNDPNAVLGFPKKRV